MSNQQEATQTAADQMVELLVDRWGVRHIFGLPGDGINPLMDSLRRRQDDVQFIQVRHEEAAAFAAVGYAKFSGRLGVCISTTGPGATHLLTGLYDAKLDQVPVLAITGLPYHDLIGQEYQQDVPTDRMMQDVAVYSERIMGPGHVQAVTNLAVRAALGRRGVAHISFPQDFQEAPLSSAKYSPMDQPNHTSSDLREPVVLPAEEDLRAAAEVLNAGRKVVILIGSGARNARDEVEQAADLLAAPVAKALLGKDVLPDDNPFTTGGIGVIGTDATQAAMDEADTLLMVGTSFPYISYLPKIDRGVRAVQIDLNPQRVGLRFPVEVGLVGDSQATLRALLPLLQRAEDRSFLQRIQGQMREWRETVRAREAVTDLPMKPELLVRALSDRLADDAIICSDSGTSVMWLSRDLDIRPNQRLSVSGLLASMGCGLPYALGAQLAFPERQVVAVVGDGALAMLPGELATLATYRLPVKIIVLKNNAFDFIRWEQMLYGGTPEYGVAFPDIDFVKIAEGFGVKALHLEEPGQAGDVVGQLLAADGPVLLEAVVDAYEPILPGKVRPQQAEHVASSLGEGQPRGERIGEELLGYTSHGSPENRELVVEKLEQKAPETLAESEQAEQPSGRPGHETSGDRDDPNAR